ncbi:Uncharacterised protein [Streptococcus pneumoniae]|nr:Uncharacterised protein [Streptococcus pneumoniae]
MVFRLGVNNWGLNNDLTQKEIIEVLERCCFSIEKRWEKLAIFTEKGRKSIEI